MTLLSHAAAISFRRQSKSVLVQNLQRRNLFTSAMQSQSAMVVVQRNSGTYAPISYNNSHRCTIGLFSKSKPIPPSQQIRSMVSVTITQTSKTDTQQTPSSNNTADPPTTNTTTNHTIDDLTITPSCISRIQQLASQRPNPSSIYLRLYVDAGGCSGFQYKFLLLSQDDTSDDEEEDGTIDPEEDIVYNVDGARLVIDTTSLELLRGSTIDYVQEMIRSSFAVVNNPNSESACGCGSSFAVKKFQANPALD